MNNVFPRHLAGCRLFNPQAFVFAAIATPLLFFSFPSTTASAGVRAYALVEQTNAIRTAAEARALAPDSLLTVAAQQRAEEIIAAQQFAHMRPDGTSFATAVLAAQYPYERVAENIAMDFFDETRVLSAWEQSASHRENLFGDYEHIGIGVATGAFQGIPTIVVVQLVGSAATPMPL